MINREEFRIERAVKNRAYGAILHQFLQSSLNKFKAFEFSFGVVFDEPAECAFQFTMITF